MIPLTPSQQRVYDFIRASLTLGSICPSLKEIAAGLGLKAESSIHSHIESLVEKGWLKRKYNRARSLRLAKSKTCPHCGGEL